MTSSASPDPARLLNYLIGQVMAKTQGRANPQVVRALLVERLTVESTDPANAVP